MPRRFRVVLWLVLLVALALAAFRWARDDREYRRLLAVEATQRNNIVLLDRSIALTTGRLATRPPGIAREIEYKNVVRPLLDARADSAKRLEEARRARQWHLPWPFGRDDAPPEPRRSPAIQSARPRPRRRPGPRTAAQAGHVPVGGERVAAARVG